MKNKILLGSVTVLSALVFAACGNSTKETKETTTVQTTEAVKETTTQATTQAPTTTGASSEEKEISLNDTQRVGRDDTGYVNVPKDWVNFKDVNGGPQFQYSALDGYNIVTLNGFTQDQAKPGEGETWGAEMIAHRLAASWSGQQNVDKIQGSKTKVSGMDAYLLQLLMKDGKYYFTWIFEKGDKVYTASFEGDKKTIVTMIALIEQTWGLDPKKPGK